MYTCALRAAWHGAGVLPTLTDEIGTPDPN